jgi:glycoprotein-N-acetylgalactosamine 3-beta-galactosyltransferase
LIAQCLRKVFAIGLTDTRDDQQRERFHPFAPATHLLWVPPAKDAPRDWYAEYNAEWGIQLGLDCCAPDSVSFHYIKKPAMVRHLFALLYQCPQQEL